LADDRWFRDELPRASDVVYFETVVGSAVESLSRSGSYAALRLAQRGAVEAALIGGLAAFGVPAAVAVPSVLFYRVLTCWLPVFVGWPVMRWLTDKDMV
jgi:hypothetical protein